MDLNEVFRIEANVILEEQERVIQEALKQAEMDRLKVPVTMRGNFVGFADLNKDGSMTIEIEANPAGEQLRKMLLDATVNCVSVGPNPKSPVVAIFEPGGGTK